jgi:hypothetical protein
MMARSRTGAILRPSFLRSVLPAAGASIVIVKIGPGDQPPESKEDEAVAEGQPEIIDHARSLVPRAMPAA